MLMCTISLAMTMHMAIYTMMAICHVTWKFPNEMPLAIMVYMAMEIAMANEVVHVSVRPVSHIAAAHPKR